MDVLIWVTMLLFMCVCNAEPVLGAEAVNNKTNSGKDQSNTHTVTPTVTTGQPTSLTTGQQNTLNSTAPGLCSGSVLTITWTWRGAAEDDSLLRGDITAYQTENVTAVTQRHSSTLTFNSSAEHHGTSITCKVSFTGGTTTEEKITLNMTYVNELQIHEITTVKEGDVLNLTCSIDGFTVSSIKWIKSGSDKTETGNETQASLIIPNVTADDSGQYTCEVKYQNITLRKHINISIPFRPRILNGSACVVQSGVLTCVCVSEGLPLPTIKWQLYERYQEYCVSTKASNSTVNSTITITVSVTDNINASIECISSNNVGETKENLTSTASKNSSNGLFSHVLEIVKQSAFIIGFGTGVLIGILLSSIVACLAVKCRRRKKKRSVYLAEDLEMVTTQAVPLMDADEGVVDNGIYNLAAEAAEGEAESPEQSAPDGDTNNKEVEYSDIDFSLVKRKNPSEAGELQDTETEYAEIKKEEIQERLNNAGDNGEMLEGSEENQGMIDEGNEMGIVPAEEDGGEDAALYSTVDELRDGDGEVM